MSKAFRIIPFGLALLFSAAASGYAGPAVKKTAVVDHTKVMVEIKPAARFYTAKEASDMKPTEGMLIMSGATPVQPDSSKHPNRHLDAHVYDHSTGKAITNADVSMKFKKLDPNGKAGSYEDVPIVEMQDIGKGVESTHYGNNVVMPAGNYDIMVKVNGKQADFRVMLPSEGQGAKGKDKEKDKMRRR